MDIFKRNLLEKKICLQIAVQLNIKIVMVASSGNQRGNQIIIMQEFKIIINYNYNKFFILKDFFKVKIKQISF